MLGEVSPVLKGKEADEQTPERVSGRTHVRGRLLSRLSPQALAIRAPPPFTLHLYTRAHARVILTRTTPYRSRRRW